MLLVATIGALEIKMLTLVFAHLGEIAKPSVVNLFFVKSQSHLQVVAATWALARISIETHDDHCFLPRELIKATCI
jgi:hypothetical protein